MGFDVKNTTRIRLLDCFCPHTCRGCGRLGWVLCDCCKNDILKAQKKICPVCKEIVADCYQKCPNCDLEFDELYVGWFREEIVAKMIREYKYEAVRAWQEVLVEMIDQVLPREFESHDKEVVIIPLPTIGKHVRERGLDHTFILASKLAKIRQW